MDVLYRQTQSIRSSILEFGHIDFCFGLLVLGSWERKERKGKERERVYVALGYGPGLYVCVCVCVAQV
jgi:hypothetical protein